MTEATCHAICEVVERDATALWNAGGAGVRGRTGLSLASVTDPSCLEVLAKLAHADFEVSVWDTTSDIGIPAFFCLMTDRRDPLQHLGIGAGCHPSPAIALLRALTEAVQVRTTYISGARDDLLPSEYSGAERARKANVAAEWRKTHRPVRDFAAIPDRATDSFDGDLKWLIGRLRVVGVNEVVAVDLSKPDLGLAVVRVVIPGLEGPHDHPGYIPGPRARHSAGIAR